MNKTAQLLELRADLQDALAERKRAGGFDANAEHMVLILTGLLQVVDHAYSLAERLEKTKK